MCIWCKLPPWFEKVSFASSGIIPSQSCICAKYSMVWRLATFVPYVSLAHQATNWLNCSRRRSFFIRANHMTYARTSLSAMTVPHLNSVVFYYKTTTWSCLSWIACSQVCSKTSSCFGACYRSSCPENLATSSRRIALQTFIFLSRLDESGISWHQPDLNVKQVWWLERVPRIIILLSL